MQFNKNQNWFKEKRFGMFVHWGLYSIPAIHEQYWQRGNIETAEYVKLADEFDPEDFYPASWLDLAQEAGMEYLVFTTKHELYDAADIDGAGELTKFWRITFPMSKPILAVIALSAFTLSYGGFMWAFLTC